MNQNLTEQERQKLFKLCIENPSKACSIAQQIIDNCQIMSISTFASIKNKSKRTIQYNSDKLTGITIEKRRFICLVQ